MDSNVRMANYLRVGGFANFCFVEMKMVTLVPPSVIACPSCPRCGSRMRLAIICPTALGRDERTYECLRCEYEVVEDFQIKKAS